MYSRCSALYTPGQRCVIANLLANFHMSAKMLSICASGGTKSLNDESKQAGKLKRVYQIFRLPDFYKPRKQPPCHWTKKHHHAIGRPNIF